ncbi:carnitine o-acyltransferase [Holotrichia oblita]|uniref:Carnitine o-acyltransferase n=1 Tax=Holotrichia oblita TaxID=644536 RepID=A0ACB9TVB7_HOLOL|nr:carnitine o-acyltransferase [Holotrichia oblita]
MFTFERKSYPQMFYKFVDNTKDLGKIKDITYLDYRFAENGDLISEIETIPPPPIRLQWEIKPDVEMKIEHAVENAQKLINDLDLHVFAYRQYGKGFIKTCKVSPDAFIQMAIQLTYYRDAGKFSLTYEACMTRLYREGRTETVRPCTVESSSWVKAMENKNTTSNERIQLLRAACERHQRNYLDAMCGKGVDRHLFCLYVVSKYLEIESPFLQEVLNEPWRLSTSQSPLEQMGFDFKKYPECLGTGGGFGPVDDDGYGVSYIIAGENILFFHISNKKSSKLTVNINSLKTILFLAILNSS